MTRMFDTIDRALLARLMEDGRTALAELSKQVGISRPTAGSRLRLLMEDGLLRVSGLIDVLRVRGLTVALVGLTVDKHQLDEKVEQIAALDEVTWAAVVTGRYDIMAEVVTEDGVNGLYDFLNTSLRSVGGISASEMFVVLETRNKWMRLPPGLLRSWLPPVGGPTEMRPRLRGERPVARRP